MRRQPTGLLLVKHSVAMPAQFEPESERARRRRPRNTSGYFEGGAEDVSRCRAKGCGHGLLLVMVLCVLPMAAAAQDLDAVSRRLTNISADIEQLTKVQLSASQLRGRNYVEERLTDGELFFRLKDYIRASIIYTDIVEKYPTHAAYPEALFMLGDSLFHAGDFLGARARFRQVLDRADEGAFRPYLQNALARLIEIAVRIHDFSGVDAYFERLSRLPTSEVAAATAYFRGKYLYGMAVPEEAGLSDAEKPAATDQDKLEEARAAFQAVPTGSPYYMQARYFIGVIYTLQGQLAQAVNAFQLVAKVRASTPEQRKVLELAQLALGRLYYETAQLDRAINAYQGVQRTSTAFDAALYEVAWAHIYRGDATRAERSLEVLSIAAPDSRYIPDGKILRGNLLLRDGSFQQADSIFKEVTDQFEPVRKQIEQVVADHPNREEYFRSLVQQNMEAFDAAEFLPPLTLHWTNFQGDMQHAMGILSDLSQTRQLVTETGNVITRMTAALEASNQTNIFPDLRAHTEQITMFRNKLARVRQELIAAEEEAVAASSNSELADVRRKRRAIEAALGRMPTDADDFRVRNEKALEDFKALDKALSEVEVQIMGMEARITAADRFMTDTMKERKQAEGVAAIRSELANHSEGIKAYRQRISELSVDIEAARMGVGVGDSAFVKDESLRNEYNQLVARERELLGKGGSREAARIDYEFGRLASQEALLDQQDARVKKVVDERVAEIRGLLEEERAKLAGYRQQLEALAGETEIVVGWVTWENFMRVQKRFYDLVLKADVGRIDVSWADREEHRMRVEMLTLERTRQIEALDQEFKEIMDQQAESSGGRM